MTFILQTVTSTVQKEIVFNSHCRKMAKDNMSLAGGYIKGVLTGVFTHPVTTSKTPLTLKDRCINFIKAPLLLVRAPLLCLPLTNRVTQLALRFLSSKLSIDYINSPEFKENEVKVKYSKKTLCKFVEDYFKNKITQKEAFNSSSLSLFDKLGFASKECLAIFTQLSPPLSIDLINSPKFKEDEVKARYSKETLCKFVEELIQEKIQGKITKQLQITKNDFKLSDEEKAAITKLGFKDNDYSKITLKFLAEKAASSNIIYSSDLKNKISLYLKKYPLN